MGRGWRGSLAHCVAEGTLLRRHALGLPGRMASRCRRWLEDAVPLVSDIASDVGTVFDALGVSPQVRRRLRELLVGL